MADLVAEGVHFVIRLNWGSNPPIFLDPRGKRIELDVAQGSTGCMLNVRYRGHVRVNLIGIWKTGLHEPLWVMTDLSPQQGLQIYFARMKIDETFRDLKNLLQLHRVMNKQQPQMEKIVALVLLAYTIGYLVGEELRDVLYGPAPEPPQNHSPLPAIQRPQPLTHPKRGCFSGLFILLKFDHPLPATRLKPVVNRARKNFMTLVRGGVRTRVRTLV